MEIKRLHDFASDASCVECVIVASEDQDKPYKIRLVKERLLTQKERDAIDAQMVAQQEKLQAYDKSPDLEAIQQDRQNIAP